MGVRATPIKSRDRRRIPNGSGPSALAQLCWPPSSPMDPHCRASSFLTMSTCTSRGCILTRLPLFDWLTGARPLTGLSYWLNYQMGGAHTLAYHLTNILLHVIAALDGVSDRAQNVGTRLHPRSTMVRRRTLWRASAALFLLHPLQTEAVAYIPSRSENLSVALAFTAWACFLYRPCRRHRHGRTRCWSWCSSGRLSAERTCGDASPGAAADGLLLESRFLFAGHGATGASTRHSR